LKIKEQEKLLTLNEHDVDDEDEARAALFKSPVRTAL
jgi:hypothetical protein